MGIGDFLSKMKNVRLLPPREKHFFNMFCETGKILVEAAGMLIDLFNAEVAQRQEIETEIGTCAARLNRMGDQIEDLLMKSQQPPFDRLEISLFVDRSSRVLRYINHSANRYVVYDFPSSDMEMREFAALISEACRNIAQAIDALTTTRNIDPFCRIVDRLEQKADEIYHGGLRRRFHEIRTDRVNLSERIRTLTDKTVVAEIIPIISANVEYTRHAAIFFILRQVYAELERAMDACSDVTASLKRMVAENV